MVSTKTSAARQLSGPLSSITVLRGDSKADHAYNHPIDGSNTAVLVARYVKPPTPEVAVREGAKLALHRILKRACGRRAFVPCKSDGAYRRKSIVTYAAP